MDELIAPSEIMPAEYPCVGTIEQQEEGGPTRFCVATPTEGRFLILDDGLKVVLDKTDVKLPWGAIPTMRTDGGTLVLSAKPGKYVISLQTKLTHNYLQLIVWLGTDGFRAAQEKMGNTPITMAGLAAEPHYIGIGSGKLTRKQSSFFDYVGGNPTWPKPKNVLMVLFGRFGITVKNNNKIFGFIPWADVNGVQVDGSLDATKVRGHSLIGGGVVEHGLLLGGALRTPGRTVKSAYLIIETDRGDVVFHSSHVTAMELRAAMSGISGSISQFREAVQKVAEMKRKVEDLKSRQPEQAPVPEPQRATVADELLKLAALRDQGILTDEEFAAQKARLLQG